MKCCTMDTVRNFRTVFLVILLIIPIVLVSETIDFPRIDLSRDNIDINISRPKRDLDRKAGGRIEVLPTPKGNVDGDRHMSPPNVTYKPYCVNQYLYIMFIISYGWDPSTGRAERVETQIQQQFDKYGRAIVCQ